MILYSQFLIMSRFVMALVNGITFGGIDESIADEEDKATLCCM